jgi:hypothetical protein
VAYLLDDPKGVLMPYTVIWYGRQGIIEKVSFDAERDAREHAIAKFPARKADDGVVAVEVRNDKGAVVFSRAGS